MPVMFDSNVWYIPVHFKRHKEIKKTTAKFSLCFKPQFVPPMWRDFYATSGQDSGKTLTIFLVTNHTGLVNRNSFHVLNQAWKL